MKKVLVIGGTRFFGKHLVFDLVKKGYEVSIATRGITQDPFEDKVNHIHFDRKDEVSIISNLSKQHFDIIYDNLAYSSNDIEILLSHVSCDKYVVVSSLSVYDSFEGVLKEKDFDPYYYPYENIKSDPDKYAGGKRLMEASVVQRFPQVNAIIVRLPFVVGIDNYTKRLYKYIDCYVNKKALFIDNLDNKLGLIDSKEAGEFLSYLGDEQTFEGIINGASDGSISLNEILSLISYESKEEINRNIEALFMNSEAEEAPYNGAGSYEVDISVAKAIGYSFTSTVEWMKPLVDAYVEEAKVNK